MYGGKRVEVLNTDAEGRLILADAIARACEDSPDYLIETSTLTGGQVVALGKRTAGVMGTTELRDRVVAAGDAGRRAACGRCRCPTSCARAGLRGRRHRQRHRRPGRRHAAGGVFLREFVADGVPWAHIDIAGPAYQQRRAVGLHAQGRHRRAGPHPRRHAGGHRRAGLTAGRVPSPAAGTARVPRWEAAVIGRRPPPVRRDQLGDPRWLRPTSTRHPRRRQRRLRLRAAGRPARPDRRADREGQARRHLPAPRLHPDQGAAARRRGRRPDPGERAVRRQGDARRHRHARRQRSTRTASSAGSTRACRAW